MDGGAWWATVYGVTQSQTWLKRLSSSSSNSFFLVQLSHPYMTTGKTIALTRQIFVGKVMSLLFNMLSAAAAAAAAAKSLQSCLTLCDPIDSSPPGSALPEILQTRKTGVGCHFLLQCMKMKSEIELAQSCPTLRDPMDHSLLGLSIHGIFQARVLEWGAIAFSKRKLSSKELMPLNSGFREDSWESPELQGDPTSPS